MNKVIYSVEMNLERLGFINNIFHINEHSIVKEEEDRYMVLGQEYEDECDYYLEQGMSVEEIEKEVFCFDILKNFDEYEDEISLDVPLYPTTTLESIGITVFSLNKKNAFKIAKDYIKGEIESSIKILEIYDLILSSTELEED